MNMNTLYAKNGLIFWSEQEIRIRRMLEQHFTQELFETLKKANRAFDMFQVEAPILTPRSFINVNYSPEDMFTTADDLVLRPETTMGSFEAIKQLLDPYSERKVKLPIVVWQHGKSFRREQDQPSKFMRLKEFYQLEFQIAYSPDTKMDYASVVIPAVHEMMNQMIGACHTEPSDRVPSYSEGTTDIICGATGMEVCSISQRKDFLTAKILEVAIGTDRCIYNFLNK
jgi:glycyl-tRNA synthetase